ncbi:MAG: hypothetical protein E7Z90_01145 [Cyanobacteria bacterium SIG29]|nr:hypothetical protein [Cyanobacteria bacterium SIG29]
MISQALVEQHIHGAFGIDFMTCSTLDMLEVSKKLLNYGVGYYFPTIMTDKIDVIKERLNVVKEAKSLQTKKMAQIVGVHLEGPFINSNKAGIHNKEYILPLEIEKYKQIDDEIIKIVTLAPELDNNGEFTKYLHSKGVKVSAGHTLATDLSNVNQVTHLYNAMGNFSHRDDSTVVSALVENIYVELIADSMHINDDVLKLTFKQKDLSQILLISDALPLAHSEKNEHIFASQLIFNKNGRLVNADGVFAGSSMLLADIVKNLVDKNILNLKDALICASSNQLKYHNLNNNLNVYWNELNRIEKVELL